MENSDNQSTPVAGTQLDALAELRRRYQQGYQSLAEQMMPACGRVPGPNEPINLDGMPAQLHRLSRLGKQYIRGLNDLRDTASRQTLSAARRPLVKRLEDGWLMEPSERASQAQIDRQFDKLLGRYEVLSDALHTASEVGAEMERKQAMIQRLLDGKRAESVAA